MEKLETLRRLDQVLPYRLVLVITSHEDGARDRLEDLLVEWSSQGSVRVARLGLEDAHNSPERFLDDLRLAWESAGRRIIPPGEISLEDGLIGLVNASLTTSGETILVLEDYHVIQNAEVHAGLSLLLDYMPPRLHLVLTSRLMPPLPIPRLRVREQVMEVSL